MLKTLRWQNDPASSLLCCSQLQYYVWRKSNNFQLNCTPSAPPPLRSVLFSSPQHQAKQRNITVFPAQTLS
jgi:hypothetical protein